MNSDKLFATVTHARQQKMQILNKFPWLRAALRQFEELGPELHAMEELQKCNMPEAYFSANGLLFAPVFRPECSYDGLASPAVGPSPNKHNGVNKKIVLSFNADECLRLVTSVPAVHRKKTLGILQLGLRKVLPMTVDSYLMGWHEIGHVGQSRQIEKVILKSNVVEEAERRLAEAGYRPAAIVFRQNGGHALPIAILKDGSEFGEDRHRFWLGMIAAGLLIFVISGCSVGWAKVSQFHESLAVIENLNSKLLSEVELLKAKQADNLKFTTTLLAARKNRKGNLPISTVIEELAKIIPQHTYLTKVLIDQKAMIVEGLSVEPEALVSILEQSPLFAGVSFTAPVFKNPGESQSRFSVQITLENANKDAK